MKANELLLSVYLVAIQPLSFGQTQQSSLPSEVKANAQTLQTNMFRVFTGGINAIYSNDAAKGGIDLSVQTYHYYLVTGTKEIDTASKSSNSTQTSFRQQYNGFEFYLLNRAAMNFDTSRSMANDYITSLQASPLTLRFMKEIFLTKQPENTTTSYAPIISIRLISDGRAIPYEDSRSQISFGASGNFYVTLSSQFTRLEFDHSGKEMDRGTMYFQPSFGIAVGNGELMKSVFTDKLNKILLSSECRLGFKSHSKSVNDCSLLVRYTLSDIVGPKLRAGIILSSFN